MSTRPAAMEPVIFCGGAGRRARDSNSNCGDCLQRLPPDSKDSPVHIIPVRVGELLTESFKLELLLQGGTHKLDTGFAA